MTTISTTFYTPFHAARLLASLDHISGGRAGWNVVTSMFDQEARNHGLERCPITPPDMNEPTNLSKWPSHCGIRGRKTR